LGAEAHLNTCFKHFIYFVHEFKLVDPKELQPLRDLIDSLMGKEKEIKREGGGTAGPKAGGEKKSKKKDGEGGGSGEKKSSSSSTPENTDGNEKGISDKDKSKENNASTAAVPTGAPPPTKGPS